MFLPVEWNLHLHTAGHSTRYLPDCHLSRAAWWGTSPHMLAFRWINTWIKEQINTGIKNKLVILMYSCYPFFLLVGLAVCTDKSSHFFTPASPTVTECRNLSACFRSLKNNTLWNITLTSLPFGKTLMLFFHFCTTGWNCSGSFAAWQFNCFLSGVLLMNSSVVDLHEEPQQSYSELVGFSLQKGVQSTWCFHAVQVMIHSPLDKSPKHHKSCWVRRTTLQRQTHP